MVKIVNKNGNISISSEVFLILAGDAASKCFGVKGMVSQTKENGFYQLLKRENMTKGVSAVFNDDCTASITLHIAVDYGVNIAEISKSIMKEVGYRVTEMTGVNVKSVDVYVDSVVFD